MSASPSIKVCVWMNIPSHYQSAFFRALHARDDVDLSVCYLQRVSESRAAEGWKSDHVYESYEHCCDGSESVEEMVKHVPDWQMRTHLISSYFSSELIDYFCVNKVDWCYWSEMPGIRLAEALGFRMALFRLLNPAMLLLKARDGMRIKRHALGAFAQGRLAQRAFRWMGVPERKISDLYYVPAALPETEPCGKVVSFAAGRKVFAAVGALCRRKGIDVLLKAFATADPEDWCLVLCGLDREKGAYQALAKRLGIDDRVLFLGARPVERISEVYAAADVFVLPSRFDGWGAVLNEAASLGLPLIATDLCGGAWHVVEPGVTGYRVKAGSVKDLSDALRKYISEPERCRAHGDAAKKRYLDVFTPAANAMRLVEGLRKWGME